MRTSLRHMSTSALLAAAVSLAGCGSESTPAPAPPPPATPTPNPPPVPPVATAFDVTPCLNQLVVPGRTLANLVVPDVLNLDVTKPSAFPNGRQYLDPVIDVTLAVIFLDLSKHSATTFSTIPLGPNGVDQPLPNTFPFLAPPLGNPPTSGGAGSNFTFRSDPASAYVRVDRAGMPGVATALVTGNANKNEYNDDNPMIDAGGKWVPELVASLTFLTNVLVDDLTRLRLTPCARPL